MVLALALLGCGTQRDAAQPATPPPAVAREEAPVAEAGAPGDVDSAQLRLARVVRATLEAAGADGVASTTGLEACGDGRARYRLRSSPPLPQGADPAAMGTAVRSAWEDLGLTVTELRSAVEGVPPGLAAEGDGFEYLFFAGAAQGREVLETGGATPCRRDLLAGEDAVSELAAEVATGRLENLLTATAEEVAPGAGFRVDDVRPSVLACRGGQRAYLGLQVLPAGGPEDALAAVAEGWRAQGFDVAVEDGGAVRALGEGYRLVAAAGGGGVALRGVSPCLPEGSLGPPAATSPP